MVAYRLGMKKAVLYGVVGVLGLLGAAGSVAVVAAVFFGDKLVTQFASPSFQAGYFEGACMQGDPDDCFERGRIAEDGLFGKPEDATRFYSRACRLGHREGCDKSSAKHD